MVNLKFSGKGVLAHFLLQNPSNAPGFEPGVEHIPVLLTFSISFYIWYLPFM